MKTVSTKYNCSFLISVFSTPPDNKALQKNFHQKDFPWKKLFFWKIVSLSSFLCTPFDKFCQTIQYSFFLKVFSYDKKMTWKKGFNFQYQSSVPPLMKMSFKYVAWRNTFLKKTVFLNCDFFNEVFTVYPY